MRTAPALAVAAACSLAAYASPVRDGQKTLGAEYGLDREHKSVVSDSGIDYDELLRSHPAYHRISRPELQRLREHYSCADKDAECLLKDFPEFEMAVQDLETEQKYLIELAPGKTLWASDMDKLNLRRQGVNFFDVTDAQDLGFSVADVKKPSIEYPEEVAHQKSIKPLLKKLNKHNMEAHLTKFSSFWTRYYKSDSGKESSAWLLKEVEQTLKKSGATKNGATVRAFPHPWGQNSIIAQIPGKSNSTVVIGAHQDSINLLLPALFQAPGADDDGSGTVTILEALRVLLKDEDVIAGKADNTIEFHWYSAEEGGLLGSQALFLEYEKQGRDVKAMLQQDMTGYVTGTLNAGQPESVGVIEDYVDPGLTEFIKKVIVEYCDIPFVLTKCGYACSDHASASKAGYPSAFVIESEFKNSDMKIHTTEDKIEYLSFDHMLQHARLTLGLVYELGFAKL